jgi:hypothetical protein
MHLMYWYLLLKEKLKTAKKHLFFSIKKLLLAVKKLKSLWLK